MSASTSHPAPGASKPVAKRQKVDAPTPVSGWRIQRGSHIYLRFATRDQARDWLWLTALGSGLPDAKPEDLELILTVSPEDIELSAAWHEFIDSFIITSPTVYVVSSRTERLVFPKRKQVVAWLVARISSEFLAQTRPVPDWVTPEIVKRLVVQRLEGKTDESEGALYLTQWKFSYKSSTIANQTPPPAAAAETAPSPGVEPTDEPDDMMRIPDNLPLPDLNPQRTSLLSTPAEQWLPTARRFVWISSLGRLAHLTNCVVTRLPLFAKSRSRMPLYYLSPTGSKVQASVRTLMRNAFFPGETRRLVPRNDDAWDNSRDNLIFAQPVDSTDSAASTKELEEEASVHEE